MKYIIVAIIVILFQSCSFDQKSGIWTNDDKLAKEKIIFKDFKKLSSANQSFDRTIKLEDNFKFTLPKVKNNIEWKDIFYDKTNNTPNFKYKGLENLVFKSKKVSRFGVGQFLLYEDSNLILTDDNGNLIIFSTKQNKVLRKFNFYKKKYKNIKKKLNIVINKGVIYITDNFGYIYAYDYNKDKILWAKNYKIPFRSNLKINNEKLITSNQNNHLYFIDIKNGDQLKLIPTEETTVKNEFINNISLNDEQTLFLNTYGSLYAIDNENMRINWFINLNQSIDLNLGNLFESNPVINNGKIIVISSNQFTYILDNKSGSIIHKKNFSALIKPIIIEDYLFLITKNNLLISMNLESGKIIYSFNIDKKIADFLNTKKKKAEYKKVILANDKILIFLKNSYVLTFNIYGELEKINKLPSKMKTSPIIVDRSILYLNKNNKLTVIN